MEPTGKEETKPGRFPWAAGNRKRDYGETRVLGSLACSGPGGAVTPGTGHAAHWVLHLNEPRPRKGAEPAAPHRIHATLTQRIIHVMHTPAPTERTQALHTQALHTPHTAAPGTGPAGTAQRSKAGACIGGPLTSQVPSAAPEARPRTAERPGLRAGSGSHPSPTCFGEGGLEPSRPRPRLPRRQPHTPTHTPAPSSCLQLNPEAWPAPPLARSMGPENQPQAAVLCGAESGQNGSWALRGAPEAY